MRRPPTLLLAMLPVLPVLLAGCAARAPEPVPIAAVPDAAPMPAPPGGISADTELLPTPNHDLTQPAALWHLRAGLNVAALQCAPAGSALEGDYNRLLAVHRRALAAAHRALLDAADSRAAFDRAMTRVYNYFAQPPARGEFCATAARVAGAIAATDPGSVTERAPEALEELDRPFVQLKAAQADYIRRLAAWREGAVPHLGYDPAIFLASDMVTADARSAQR